MIHVRRIDEVRAALSAVRRDGRRIGLVPTMGALHAGHLELIRQVRGVSDTVVTSIFVNPTQFGPNEDLARYPRPLSADLALAASEGVDIVFHPDPADMYPGDMMLSIGIRTMADHLCGASRPGHFTGVLQIVNKLFNIVRPDVAAFGQKDIQQYRLIETMVHEFDHGVELLRVATVREADGLAMSSRNAYLTAAERAIAPDLYKELLGVETALRNDRDTPIPGLVKAAIARLREKGFKNDYLSVVDYATLTPVRRLERNKTGIIAGAQYLGTTRLIDNVIVTL